MTRQCSIAGCEKAAKPGYRDAICPMHRERIRRHGSVENPRPKSPVLYWNGYRNLYLPRHPLAMPSTGYVQEHRMLLWEHLGPGSQPCHWCGLVVDWLTPFPAGLVVDHVDANRRNNALANLVPSCAPCNSRRMHLGRMHCKNGHELTDENVYIYVTGTITRRRCRTCGRDRSRRYEQRKRSAQP